ncbi:hypothetical protein [Dongia sp.]|uniref:hypothetical protein n=1 Tax=Dongia sp. TaxID=1977262 RepID=UPI00375060B7
MGTRFNLFVQPPIQGDRNETEVISVSSPAGSLRAGPADDRMYTVEPVGKTYPYGASRGPYGTPFIYLPPWTGRRRAPAEPNDSGHFDHLHPGDPGFNAAHVFGAIRFTLDVWERYLGQPVLWHFQEHFDRLEISLLPEWNNAQYGYGYLEIGSLYEHGRRIASFALDFDVIAHEVGHAVVYGVLGVPRADAEYPEYLGFHESFSDLVSLLAAMHFPSVVTGALAQSGGNLSRENRLTRFAEFAPHRQLRRANNRRTMAEFTRRFKDEHALSQPLTGAIFDILSDVYHENLVELGLISREIENLADIAEHDSAADVVVQQVFEDAFASDPPGFRAALEQARDVIGAYLAETLWGLRADFLDYGDVARAFSAADRVLGGGRYARIIRRNFAQRGIGRFHAGKRERTRSPHSHAGSDRTLLPSDCRRLPAMSYRELYTLKRTIVT